MCDGSKNSHTRRFGISGIRTNVSGKIGPKKKAISRSISPWITSCAPISPGFCQFLGSFKKHTPFRRVGTVTLL